MVSSLLNDHVFFSINSSTVLLLFYNEFQISTDQGQLPRRAETEFALLRIEETHSLYLGK